MLNYKHILFDLDGTLIDSAPSILECYRLVLAQFSIKPRFPLESHLIGPPLEATLHLISGTADKTIISEMSSFFKVQYDSIGVDQSVAYLGINELLKDLHDQGKKLYIVTNKRISVTYKILNVLNWSHFFEGVYSQDAFNPFVLSKPAVIERVLDLHSIPTSQAVYIGDRSEDGEAAFANGLNFIWVSWGYGCPNYNNSFDYEVARSTSELNNYLSQCQ